jgi:hypothetical protein
MSPPSHTRNALNLQIPIPIGQIAPMYQVVSFSRLGVSSQPGEFWQPAGAGRRIVAREANCICHFERLAVESFGDLKEVDL